MASLGSYQWLCHLLLLTKKWGLMTSITMRCDITPEANWEALSKLSNQRGNHLDSIYSIPLLLVVKSSHLQSPMSSPPKPTWWKRDLWPFCWKVNWCSIHISVDWYPDFVIQVFAGRIMIWSFWSFMVLRFCSYILQLKIKLAHNTQLSHRFTKFGYHILVHFFWVLLKYNFFFFFKSIAYI